MKGWIEKQKRFLWIGIGVVKGVALNGAVAWLFYRDLRGFALLPVFLAISLRREKKSEEQMQREREQQLFAEWLGFLKEALQVGYSLERAVGEAKKGVLTTYVETEPFLLAVTGMQRKMQLGVSVEEAFAGLAEECRGEEVREFAEVLFIAKRTGGAVHQVISNTERIIREKQETLRYIRGVLRSRAYELRIMKYMPFAMLLYMQLFMPDMLAPLYGNGLGVGIMSVGLGIYGGLSVMMDRIGAVSV